jgi:serine protease Do
MAEWPTSDVRSEISDLEFKGHAVPRWCALPQTESGNGQLPAALGDTVWIADAQRVVVKLFGVGGGSLDSYGSGVLISPEGHVVTVWNHLVSTGAVTAVLHDGRRFVVEIVGTSADDDLAVLKLKSGETESWPHVSLVNAVDVEPGSAVFAFSNMFRVASGNEPVSVSHGVISARVPLQAGLGKWKLPVKSPVWLVDAVINNSGAAGGLLTDDAGRPVGLIGREIRQEASRTWVNYAVPFSTLKPAVDSILAGRRIDSASPESSAAADPLSDLELTTQFGLTLIPEALERTPAWVDAVHPGSPAAAAGLRRGDLIVLIDDAVITSVADVRLRLANARKGRPLTVTVNRDDQLQAVELRPPGN